MGKFVDLTGNKYGRLTVLGKEQGRDKNGRIRWRCKCDCGKEVSIATYSLNGGVQSCGCLQHDIARNSHLIHGDCKRGGKRTRLFGIWAGIRNRILNPNNHAYPRYGGRGIKICDEWQEYIKFKEWALSHGYNEKLTIDRIDVNGDYSPENCRWASYEVQANNSRKNIFWKYKGECLTIAQWAKKLNVNPTRLWNRVYNHKWSVERALTEPIIARKRECHA